MDWECIPQILCCCFSNLNQTESELLIDLKPVRLTNLWFHRFSRLVVSCVFSKLEANVTAVTQGLLSVQKQNILQHQRQQSRTQNSCNRPLPEQHKVHLQCSVESASTWQTADGGFRNTLDPLLSKMDSKLWAVSCPQKTNRKFEQTKKQKTSGNGKRQEYIKLLLINKKQDNQNDCTF